jgi:hypothetical protein
MRHRIIDDFRWVAAMVLLVAMVTSCQHPGAREDSGVEAQSGTSDVNLLLRATKAVYAQGEPLELSLEVVNRSPRSVTLGFRTSQRYDLLIQNAQGQDVWRWSAERMFAQMLGQEALAPNGGKLTYHVVMREKLSPGSYTIVGIVPAVDAQLLARLEITIQ